MNLKCTVIFLWVYRYHAFYIAFIKEGIAVESAERAAASNYQLVRNALKRESVADMQNVHTVVADKLFLSFYHFTSSPAYL